MDLNTGGAIASGVGGAALGATTLGLGTAAVAIAGGMAQRRKMLQLRRAQDRQRRLTHDYNDRQLVEGQKDVNRSALENEHNISSDANARGITNSSIPTASTNKMHEARDRRYDALQRSREYNDQSMANSQDIQQIQLESQRLLSNMDLIQQAINGGLSGVGAHYGNREAL